MRWPEMERKAYYGMVAEKRGRDAARQLVADVSTEWRRAAVIGCNGLDARMTEEIQIEIDAMGAA